MRVRTQNGFWGAAFFAAAVALFLGGMLMGHLRRIGIDDTPSGRHGLIGAAIFFAVLFLLPVLKNFIQVLHQVIISSRAATTVRSQKALGDQAHPIVSTALGSTRGRGSTRSISQQF